jgi:acyl-CoA hydrolase
VVRVRASILAVGRTAAMEVEVDVILREVRQHRRRDVRRVPQI